MTFADRAGDDANRPKQEPAKTYEKQHPAIHGGNTGVFVVPPRQEISQVLEPRNGVLLFLPHFKLGRGLGIFKREPATSEARVARKEAFTTLERC